MESGMSLTEAVSGMRSAARSSSRRVRRPYEGCAWLMDTPFCQPPQGATPSDLLGALAVLDGDAVPGSMAEALAAWVVDYGKAYGLDAESLSALGRVYDRQPDWFTEQDRSWMVVSAAFA